MQRIDAVTLSRGSGQEQGATASPEIILPPGHFVTRTKLPVPVFPDPGPRPIFEAMAPLRVVPAERRGISPGRAQHQLGPMASRFKSRRVLADTSHMLI